MTNQELQTALSPLLAYEMITIRQLLFLLHLEGLGGFVQDSGVIRKRLKFNRPATSRIIGMLAGHGLAVRNRWDGDRRFCSVTITDAGRALVAQLCSGETA